MTDDFEATERGRNASVFVERAAAFVAGHFGVEREARDAVKPIPSESAPGFAPYTKGGRTATVDVPLSAFVEDDALTTAVGLLPRSVRDAVEAHVADTFRFHLEVASQADPDAAAIVEGWDWSKGLPEDRLVAAGHEEVVDDARRAAGEDFEVETVRFTFHAMSGHMFRGVPLSIVVNANTEFEYHQSEGALTGNIGPRKGRPSVDHPILDHDMSEDADFSAAKFDALLDVLRQSFPTVEPSPAPGM